MRPLAGRRLEGWWHSLASALILLVALGAFAGLILLLGWAGRRAILPLLGVLSILLAFTMQSDRARACLFIAGGWLLGLSLSPAIGALP